jgi:hypothetical protein
MKDVDAKTQEKQSSHNISQHNTSTHQIVLRIALDTDPREFNAYAHNIVLMIATS